MFLSKLAVDALKHAANSHHWNLSKDIAFKNAIEDMIYDIPNMPNRRKNKKRQRDLRAQIQTQIKRAATALNDALDMISALQLKSPSAEFNLDKEQVDALNRHVNELHKFVQEESSSD